MSSLRMRRRGVLASFKPRPSLDLNFANAGALDSRITFTRASSGSYFDATGTLQSAGSNVARFDFDPVTHAPRGLLIEEARTNSIRNSTMVGAASGTPGTLPTNWTQGNTNGLSVTSLTTGVFNGISCIDLRFTQTVSAGIYTLSFDATNIIAALTGQSWALSTYIGLVAGSLSNVTSVVYQNVEYTSVGGVVTSSSSSAIIPTATLTRYPAQIAVAGGGTVAFINPRFLVTTTAGAVDFTLRIGAPQLELGAFPTSFVPTSTVAVTRAAEQPTMTLGSWFNASTMTLATEGTSQTNQAGNSVFAAISDNTGSNFILSYFAGTQARIGVNLATVTILGGIGANVTSTTIVKTALSLASGNNAGAMAGVGVSSTATTFATPTLTRLDIGWQSPFGGQLNGTIRRLRYWPRAMGTAELQAVTR